MFCLVVSTSLQYEIKSMFKNMIGLKKRSINLFFTDIDKLNQAKEKVKEDAEKEIIK